MSTDSTLEITAHLSKFTHGGIVNAAKVMGHFQIIQVGCNFFSAKVDIAVFRPLTVAFPNKNARRTSATRNRRK